jgi:hypothetical protein
LTLIHDDGSGLENALGGVLNYETEFFGGALGEECNVAKVIDGGLCACHVHKCNADGQACFSLSDNFSPRGVTCD